MTQRRRPAWVAAAALVLVLGTAAGCSGALDADVTAPATVRPVD